MLEAFFTFLFKYRPVLYQRGTLTFELPPVWVLLATGVLVVLAVLAVYAVRNQRLTRKQRLIAGGIRLAAVLLLGFCLLRPVLVLATTVPQQNFLAVMVDDSRSMQLADQGGAPRSEIVKNELGP
ncbi:MAG: hypothetical protein AB7I33_00705, partial [Gemmatimonadales bacterium]